MNILTKPNDFSAAYSDLPLRVKSNNYKDKDFKYLINISYNKSYISDFEAISYNNIIYTKLRIVGHNFKKGNKVLLDTPGEIQYRGIYTVIDLIGNDYLILNFQMGEPIRDGYLYNIIPYRIKPDLDGEAKLDISNTLKDYVKSTVCYEDKLYSAEDNKFKYDIILGSESRYEFEFMDNYFDSGRVGFNNTNLTQSDIQNIPFQIGDEINIEQNQLEWNFTDNQFISGNVGFTSNVRHDFKQGQQITITGAVVNDYYNGSTTIKNVIDDYTIETDLLWGSNTQTEPGKIFGTPRPSYNTVCKIVDIFFESGYGVVIKTDVGYAGSTFNAIGGTIKLRNDILKRNLIETIDSNLQTYDARILNDDYTVDYFDRYIIMPRFDNSYISTILKTDKRYRIEKESKSYLLFRTRNNFAKSVCIDYVNKNNIKIGESEINITEDSYIPIGLDQIYNTSGFTHSQSKSYIENNMYRYVVYSKASNGVKNCEEVQFVLNDDCSKYEMLHLMWKDRLGSWLSYSFKYIHRNNSNYNRSTYQQNYGTFNDDNSYTINSTDRGNKSFINKETSRVLLNSGWVEEFENDLIRDLMNSTDVYLQKDNKLISVNILTDNIEYKQNINEQLFNYQLEVQLSKKEYRY